MVCSEPGFKMTHLLEERCGTYIPSKPHCFDLGRARKVSETSRATDEACICGGYLHRIQEVVNQTSIRRLLKA